MELFPDQPHGEQPAPAQAVTALGGLRRFFHLRHAKKHDLSQSILPSDDIQPVAAPEVMPPAEPYQALAELVSDEALQTQRHRIEAEIAEDPELSKLHEINTALHANSVADRKAYDAGNDAEVERLGREHDQLSDAKSVFSEEKRQKYRVLEEKLYQLMKNQNVVLAPEDETAQRLLSYLKEAEPVQSSSDTEAPFAHHGKNTDEVWQTVPDQTIRDYLSAKQFIRTGYGQTEAGSVTVKAHRGEAIDVPLDLLTNAEGFDSWTGRSLQYGKDWGSKYGSGTMKSLNVIKHYAGLSTKVPPVGEIRALVQPNGRILCDNGSGDSHRIAAAMLQGADTIKAESLQFVRLKQNIIQ